MPRNANGIRVGRESKTRPTTAPKAGPNEPTRQALRTIDAMVTKAGAPLDAPTRRAPAPRARGANEAAAAEGEKALSPTHEQLVGKKMGAAYGEEYWKGIVDRVDEFKSSSDIAEHKALMRSIITDMNVLSKASKDLDVRGNDDIESLPPPAHRDGHALCTRCGIALMGDALVHTVPLAVARRRRGQNAIEAGAERKQ